MLNMDPAPKENASGVDSFESVALLHMQDLHRTAAAMLRDQSQAEDVVQETYMLAWRAFSRFTPGTNCRAWLFTILFRVISHDRRKWFNRFQLSEPETLETTLVYKAPIAADLTDADILSALRMLPVRFAEVVLLADVHEFAYKEIGETLNIPIGTVMSRLSRGRSLLRSYLAPTERLSGLGRRTNTLASTMLTI